MPKVKTRHQGTVELDGLVAGRNHAEPGIVGKSARGGQRRSPVLRTIGTRSRPLAGLPLAIPRDGPSGVMGFPFRSLRVSIPGSENSSSLVGLFDRSSAGAGVAVGSSARDPGRPAQMQPPAYPAEPLRGFGRQEFGRVNKTPVISAPESPSGY